MTQPHTQDVAAVHKKVARPDRTGGPQTLAGSAGGDVDRASDTPAINTYSGGDGCTQDVAEIAGTLSKAQREMFVEAKPYGDWTLIRWAERQRPNGWMRKKLSLYWNPDFDSLTPLGKSVRAYLLSQSDGGERG